jgi:serine protease Do
VIPTKIDTVIFNANPFYHFFDDPFSNNSPFGFFFNNPQPQYRREQRPQPPVQKQERRQQGLGSGVIVSNKGYILTNFHVVSGADEIEVKLNDGRVYEAEIIGTDSLSDVAVLKIRDDVDDLPVVYLGNSDNIRPGDWVIAIGNPFSLTSTVTAGIVSALGRNVSGGDAYQNFIQTDAAINPGNSGGALVNIEGELIGINTMIYTRSGGYMGIGFAIPINMAKSIMEDLIYHGEVERGWIGVSIQDIDPATREALDFDDKSGVLIADVNKGQPAEKAGIQRGDIVMKIDGRDVVSTNQLRNLVASIKPGKKVTVKVFRNGKEIEMTLKVANRDAEKIEKLTQSDKNDIPKDSKEKMEENFGIKVANLTRELQRKYNISNSIRGVVITEIDQRYHDVRSGIRVGDVITELKTRGTEPVRINNVKDFQNAAKSVKAGDSVMLLIERQGRSFFTAFKIK